MIDCETLVEKMPMVAQAQASWTAEEAAHLAECADCASSWRIVSVAPRLGGSAAETLDISGIIHHLHSRLEQERRARRWKRAAWVTGLAAAAALTAVVWDGSTPKNDPAPVVSSTPGAIVELPLAELEGLDDDQLRAVLEGLDPPLGSTVGGPGPSLNDLDDSQLERVLRSLEG